MQWNRRNILILVFLLVLGLGSGVVIHVSEEGGVSFAMFRIRKWADGLDGKLSSSMSPSVVARAKKKADEVLSRELARYPDLQIKPKMVPEAENGFLGLLIIKNDTRLVDLQTSDITKKLDQAVINPDEVERDLEIHRAIGAEIERVASLPERSTENLPVPLGWYLPMQEIKTMSDYLLLKARLAAMRKNEAEAIRYVEMAVNLGEHLNDVERPSFISETLLILNRLALSGSVTNHILPQFGPEADLEKWRQLLKPRISNGDRLAILITTELHFFHQDFSHMIFTGLSDTVPDPEAFCVAHVARTNEAVKRYRGVDFKNLSKVKLPKLESFNKHLSRESIDLSSLFVVDNGGSWQKGFVRSAVVQAQADAAIDLLIREKKGEDLSKLTETYVLNPFTEKPFAYDATKRVLPVVPDTEGGANELKLPW